MNRLTLAFFASAVTSGGSFTVAGIAALFGSAAAGGLAIGGAIAAVPAVSLAAISYLCRSRSNPESDELLGITTTAPTNV